ncbi:MAG: glycosyltransferase family 4 protein [Deltaproteobacteria bacterium]|nr:glycosyltransferase family 4 protein [Deltaproteobacteria bacterium]
MKILVVTQYFWPENFRINDLALGLKEKGHEVQILTGMPNYPGGRFFTGYNFFGPLFETYEDIPVFRVPLIPRGNGSRFRLVLNFFSFVFFACFLAPFRRLGTIDLIFIYEPSPITVCLPALLLKKLKSAPVMFWMQDLWPESLSATGAVRSKKILRIVDILVRFIYRRCDRILIQSRSFFEPIKHQHYGPKRILYFPNSAEELYQPVILEKDAYERVLMPEGFCVTFAGNIGAAQDFGTILKAAELLKSYTEINWVIIGDGRMFPWVQSQVIKRGLNDTVHMLGRYPAETMPRFFALSDVLLVTLKKEPIFALTIPSKVQSYLACAKPIAAALDGEGAKVIEEAGAGMACPAESPKALAETVLKFYNMSETDQKEMGNKGREYFEKHFEREMLFDRLEGWMKELVTQTRHKGTKKEVKE